jgi:hypothetical protein
MSVLYNLENKEISEDLCVKLLYFTESFLVRRSLLKIEPTGLHSLYKGLWSSINSDPSVKKYIEEIEKRSTIKRPTDEEVTTAVKTLSIGKSKICNYLLVEYDKSLPGDNPSGNPSIEHILPDTYPKTGPWVERFTETEHKNLKDTFANLIPLTSPLNSSLQRSSYEIKSKRYIDESMFKTPRRIATAYKEWTLESLHKRAEKLASWVIQRWPYEM